MTSKPAASKKPAAQRIEDSDEESGDEMVLRGAKTTDIQEEYTVQAVFGSGGFSTVYTAVDNSNGDVVAIKHIVKFREEPDRMMPWDLHKQYLANEVQTLMRLSGCPNVVQLYDIYEDAGNIFMVFELIDGEELFDMICANGFYSEPEAVEILRAICRGLKACHDRNVMHRDIKPENIMCPINENNTHDLTKATIIDFGLAAILEPGTYATEASGSPGYVAPEILVGCPYDKAVDMWSLGVTAYILLAGYPPWVEDIEVPVEDQIIAGDYEFHSPEWDDVSSTAKDWIRRLLVLDPTKRMTVTEALQHPFLKLSGAVAEIKVEYADTSKPPVKKQELPPIVKPAVTKSKSDAIVEKPASKPAEQVSKPAEKPVEKPVEKPAMTPVKIPEPEPIEVKVLPLNEIPPSARVKPSPRLTSPRLTITTVLQPARKTTTTFEVIEEVPGKTEPTENNNKPETKPEEPKAESKPKSPEKIESKTVSQAADKATSPIKTTEPAKTSSSGNVTSKKCPKCSVANGLEVKICAGCGYKFDQTATTHVKTTAPATVPAKPLPTQSKPSPVALRFGQYKPPDHISHIPVIREQAHQTLQATYKPPDHISHIPVVKEQASRQQKSKDYKPPDHISHIPVIREQAKPGKSSLPKYVPPDHTTNIPVIREKWDPDTNEVKAVREIVQASYSLSQKPKFPKKGQGRPLRGRRADATDNPNK